MPHDFLPAADADLEEWVLVFDQRINAEWVSYGLTAGDAAAFHVLVLDFSAKLAVANAPASRTRVSVAAKNLSRALLKKNARQLARIINAHPGVSDQQRVDLGLALRKAAVTAIAAPSTRPMLMVDHLGRVRLVDEALPQRRGKPPGVLGAIIFAKLDGPAPVESSDAPFAGLATRPIHQVPLPDHSSGRRLWVMARWVNARGEEGPLSKVVCAMMAA